MVKDRLQNYLNFCFQNPLAFKGFWKQFSVSCFVTIPKRICIIICIALVFLPMSQGRADVYMYIDSEGVIHFTNVPTSSDYKVYIKERPGNVRKHYRATRFDNLIRKAQKKYGVDFSLIKAVIRVESGFNPNAVSKKGAKGLMQIMPMNYKSLSIKDPFDPLQNIMGGTLYLKKMLKRYDDKLPMALAAYNAGPEAVDKYQQIPPYTETQRYVRKVMKLYSQYKKS